MFLNARSRLCPFEEKLLDVTFPPIDTRWGTWLEAVEYYYFSDIKVVINSFTSDESSAVRKGQGVLFVDSLQEGLAYLFANFTFLPNTIKKLVSSGETLIKNIALILHAHQGIAAVPEGPVAEKSRAKLQSSLDKNEGFSALKEVSRLLTGEHVLESQCRLSH